MYVSAEAETALKIIDAHTLKVIESVPLSARPNNLAITPDGKKVYVGIIAPPGAIDVIDTATLEKKSIAVPGGIHNIYVTPDGKHVVAGSPAGRRLTVLDTSTDKEVWAWEGEAIRPMTISAKPDGSTDKLFVQVSGHHGFVVVDFDSRKEVARITQPDVPPEQRYDSTYNGAPAHGIGVAPDGKTLWSTSRMNSHVYVYSLPDLKLVGGVPTGTDPDWITFTPDSKLAYVANAVSNTVSVIDMDALKEVTQIPVGKGPKRNGILRLSGSH
jgi:YVTN family beta-propeller protein